MKMPTCERADQISVFVLRKHGYFRHQNVRGTLRWYSHDQLSGSVGVFFDAARRTFQCSYSVDDRDHHLSVTLTQTPCNFGGARSWFLCPGCNSRMAILYLSSDALECRRCQGLTYRSSQTTHVGQMGALIRFMQLDVSVGEEYSERRSKFWKRRPTKRHRRWLDKHRRFYAASRSVVDFERTKLHQ